MSAESASAAEQQPQCRVNFGFTRTKTGRLAGTSALAEAQPSGGAVPAGPIPELIAAIEGDRIEAAMSVAGGPGVASATEPVVPLLADQREWAAAKRRRLAAETAAKTAAAEQQQQLLAATANPAVRAILDDCRNGKGVGVPESTSEAAVLVPLPAEAPAEAPAAGAVEADVEDADYEAVAVESFGLAALRGMGFTGTVADLAKEGAKRELRVRPRGLGLGADGPAATDGHQRDRQPPGDSADQQPEELLWKAGARCRVSAGRDTGHCGTLVSADGDACRWLVSVAQQGGRTKSYPMAALQLVTEREFESGRRLLNSGRVERFRAEQARRGWLREGCVVKVCVQGHPLYARKLRVARELQDGARALLGDSDQGKAGGGSGGGGDSRELDVADLETVVPRRHGVRVIVVRGVLSGQLGRTDDDSGSRRSGLVRVRMRESGDCVSLPLDDVCEFLEAAPTADSAARK